MAGSGKEEEEYWARVLAPGMENEESGGWEDWVSMRTRTGT